MLRIEQLSGLSGMRYLVQVQLARGSGARRWLNRELEERVQRFSGQFELSARQSNVLRAVACGLSNKEIAALLALAEVTVEAHLTRIYAKAMAPTRFKLLAMIREF